MFSAILSVFGPRTGPSFENSPSFNVCAASPLVRFFERKKVNNVTCTYTIDGHLVTLVYIDSRIPEIVLMQAEDKDEFKDLLVQVVKTVREGPDFAEHATVLLFEIFQPSQLQTMTMQIITFKRLGEMGIKMAE